MCAKYESKRHVSRRDILVSAFAVTAGGVRASTDASAQAPASRAAGVAPSPRPPVPAAEKALKDQKLVQTIPIPKQSGRGVLLERGQRLKVISPRGKQVGDFFAFARHSPDEFIAPPYTMTWNRNVYLKAGMPMITNYGNQLAVLEEDTAGSNDLIWPCCSGSQNPGHPAEIPNCRDNMQAALRAISFPVPPHPELVHPHNLFQNSPVNGESGALEFYEPKARPGDYVVIRALENVVMVVTACSYPTGPVNGGDPKELLLEVYA